MSDDYRKLTFSLVNPQCPVPWHCCHFPAGSKVLLHGLSVPLSRVEWYPTAHEVRETQWNLMGCDIQYYTSRPPQNWCTCMYTCYKHGVANAAGVSREVTKCIREAAKNVLQPCQWTSHQIHRISQGTPPWMTGPLGLPSARLCIQHHQSQRGGPSFWGQGTQRQQDGHKQHTSERHCVLSALNNRNRLTCCSWTLSDVDTYVHSYIKCWRYHHNILASILTECMHWSSPPPLVLTKWSKVNLTIMHRVCLFVCSLYKSAPLWGAPRNVPCPLRDTWDVFLGD